MAVKTIAVSLADIARLDAVMSAAFTLASQHEAHVTGIYVIPAMDSFVLPVNYGAAELDSRRRQFFEQLAPQVREKFDNAARRYGVTAEWRQLEGKSDLLADTVLDHAVCADLIVAAQVSNNNDRSTVETDFVERLLLGSGRPVLVVPEAGSFERIGSHAVIGWNATREAVRASFDALPLLTRAKKVDLVWVNAQQEPEIAGDLPGAELAAVLSRHGVDVTAQSLPAPELSPADALLNHVASNGADLLVLGAYGHSRLRELVFGGVTRSILQTMTVPVLMSH